MPNLCPGLEIADVDDENALQKESIQVSTATNYIQQGCVRHTKMETTLLVSSNLTFSEYLRCLNLPLWWVQYLKRDCTSQLVLLLQAKVSIAGNSNILKILRMSSLKRQVMSFPFVIVGFLNLNDKLIQGQPSFRNECFGVYFSILKWAEI